jgi:hypothetical protein
MNVDITSNGMLLDVISYQFNGDRAVFNVNQHGKKSYFLQWNENNILKLFLNHRYFNSMPIMNTNGIFNM